MIIKSLINAIDQYGLEICPNSFEDILDLYNSDEEFAKLSNNYPVKIETIIEEVTSVPPFSSVEKKHYLSFYNLNHELVAVLDLIEEHSFKNTYGEKAVWIGLLQINKRNQNSGLGKIIIESLIKSCRENGKEIIQLGVIKDNIKALKFWSKISFETFSEVNNGEFDLYLMEKKL